ncbi:11093_t:CDS:2 [Acaulospora morrowiae]|uniref:11093_t:CDS:1 n=1 Tax=Acaulospora morrowiae TaxID=94023 RepID=A0A9N9FLI3_9GLOM|nr:11093_t:CDS:2 [Acaulospora morrowiae]
MSLNLELGVRTIAKENVEIEFKVAKSEQMLSQNDSRNVYTIVSEEKSNFIVSQNENDLTSKLDDTGETKQVNIFVPKEQPLDISEVKDLKMWILINFWIQSVREEITQIIKDKTSESKLIFY